MRLPSLLLALAALALPACGGSADANKAAPVDAAAAAPADLPVYAGPVTDQAQLIPADREASLAARLADVQRRSGRQFVVVTVTSLNGEPIEDFARRLGTAWAVGGKDRYDGLLLVVAPNEKKARIATGRGLQPVLTDEMCQAIMDRDLLPHFRKGEMLKGIEAGVASLSRSLLQAGAPERKAA